MRAMRALALFAAVSVAACARPAAAPGPAPDDGSPVLDAAQVTKGPELLNHDLLRQTLRGARAGEGGHVVVSLVIGRDGVPQQAMVRQASVSSLEPEALRVVRRLRYKPALLGDQPVRARHEVAITFTGTAESTPVGGALPRADAPIGTGRERDGRKTP